MRISDWSSDVCSSDLGCRIWTAKRFLADVGSTGCLCCGSYGLVGQHDSLVRSQAVYRRGFAGGACCAESSGGGPALRRCVRLWALVRKTFQDRSSVVWRESVPVSVDLGVVRISKINII